MNKGEDFQEDLGSVIHDVQRLQQELERFQELSLIQPALRKLQEDGLAEDLLECQARIDRLLVRINAILVEIRLTELQSSLKGTAFSLSTLANELNAQVEWLKGILEYIESWGRTAPRWFFEQIAEPVGFALRKRKLFLVPLLKRFLSKIWQIISHLLTPKEWKLSGKVGTGILGLADVGIEVTFGT